jgi:L-threonylcarbamoyladenylate synthase
MFTIQKAIEILRTGGIIGFPTDTVYGIGCDARNPDAVNRIYELKKRSPSKPLILFIKDKSVLAQYARIPDAAKALIETFWPGKLTIIFTSEPGSPIQGPDSTVAVRIPNHEPVLSILEAYENPLATTSANVEGTPAPQSDKEMDIVPDFVVSGMCGGQVSSTIIDVSSVPARLVREGAIGRIELEAVVGRVPRISLEKA